MATYSNITGVVKLLKAEGYGFILPDSVVGAHDKDIFFHAESVKHTDWSRIKIGQRVQVSRVVSNRRGLQADNVVLIK